MITFNYKNRMIRNQHRQKIFYTINRRISEHASKIEGQKQKDIIKKYEKSSKQSMLNSMYNQDIAPQDSQVTSFYYHKTLALQCFTAVFSLSSIILSLVVFYKAEETSEILIRKSFFLIVVFTALGCLTLILQKMAKSKWSIAKKKKFSFLKQIIVLIFKIIIFLPCPMQNFIGIGFWIQTNTDQQQIELNALFCFYMVVVRSYHVIIFLIHCQLFYGSRPDRLSRLYTVNFGTMNAVRFIINQKPILFSLTAFAYNFLIFPLCLLIIEGPINQNLNSFTSCLHFVVITQVTVGYGDIYVISTLGKLITYVIMMIGAIYTSFLLILFERIMKFQTNQQQAKTLFESLELQDEIKKIFVLRIQSQMIYKNSRFKPEQTTKKLHQLKAFRFENNKLKNRKQMELNNFKKSMCYSFAQIIRVLKVIQQKNNLISQCVAIVNKSLTEKTLSQQSKSNYKLNQQQTKEQAILKKLKNNKRKNSVFYKKDSIKQNIFRFDEIIEDQVNPNKNTLKQADKIISNLQQKMYAEHINKSKSKSKIKNDGKKQKRILLKAKKITNQ